MDAFAIVNCVLAVGGEERRGEERRGEERRGEERKGKEKRGGETSNCVVERWWHETSEWRRTRVALRTIQAILRYIGLFALLVKYYVRKRLEVASRVSYSLLSMRRILAYLTLETCGKFPQLPTFRV
jgi:hypothetical protein